MKDFWNSIWQNANERMTHPFWGSFALAWLIFNWRPIVYLIFSNVTIEQKIFHIEKDYSNLLFLIIYPAIVATLYSVGNPYFKLLLTKVVGFAEEKQHQTATELRVRNLTSEKRVARHEVELENERSNYRDKADLNKQVSALTEQAQVLKSQLSISSKEAVEREREIGKQKEMNSTLKTQVSNLEASVSSMREELQRNSLSNGAFFNSEFELAETFHATNGNFQRLAASVLNSEEGTVLVAFEVRAHHNKNDSMDNLYLIAHASLKGKNISGTKKYSNIWALRRVTGEKGHWGFICSNSKGDVNRSLTYQRKLEIGWHTIAVCWSRISNRIELFIDGDRKSSNQIRSWPDNVEDTFTVGSWVDNTTTTKYDFNSRVGPVKCYRKLLSGNDLKRMHTYEMISLPEILD